MPTTIKVQKDVWRTRHLAAVLQSIPLRLILILGFVVSLSAIPALADVSAYEFSSFQRSYVEVTQGTLHATGAHVTQDDKENIAIGFPFPIGGRTVTTVTIGEMGELYLQPVGESETSSSVRLWALGSNRLRPNGFELRSDVLGQIPNRVFVMQWKNLAGLFVNIESFNYQVLLHESNASIAIQYGNLVTTALYDDVKVGLEGNIHSANWRSIARGVNSWADSRRGTLAVARCQFDNRFKPLNGQVFFWEPAQLDLGLGDPNVVQTFPAGGHLALPVILKNCGRAAVTSASLEWSLDGGAIQQLSWAGNLGPGSATTLTVTTINIVANKTYALHVTAQTVNSTIDDYSTNNTVNYSFAAALRGRYSVGGTSADFVSVTEAVQHLNLAGIADDVRLDVNPGTYYGQYELGEFPRRVSTHTVTVASATGDFEDVKLVGTGGISRYNYVLHLHDVSGLNFENLTLKASSSDYTNIFRIAGRCGDIGLIGNKLQGLTAESRDSTREYALIAADLENLSGELELRNNIFDGGLDGILIRNGSSVRSPLGRLKLEGNTFVNQADYAIDVAGTSLPIEIVANRFTFVDLDLTNARYTAIQMQEVRGQWSIRQNRISGKGLRGPQSNAIALMDCSGIKTRLALFVNNEIFLWPLSKSPSDTAQIHGLHVDACEQLLIAHNTIYTSGVAVVPLGIRGPVNIECFNNVFASLNTEAVSISQDPVALLMDYNAHFAPQAMYQLPDDRYENSRGYWERLTPFDQNSILADPQFVSLDSLRPRNSAYNSAAVYLEQVDCDINGQPRDSQNRDLGAYAWDDPTASLDIGLRNMRVPSFPLKAGVHSVSIELSNHCSAAVTSAVVQWQRRSPDSSPGSSTVTIVTSVFLGTLGPAESTTLTVDISRSALDQTFVLSANVNSVNGLVDEVPVNNTRATLIPGTCMSGDYTIGGQNASFASIKTAVEALQASGVCGPVRLLLRNGIYNGVIRVPKISGTSTLNTITLRSEDGNADSVVVRRPLSSETLFTLDGVSYFRFHDLTIGTENQVGIGVLVDGSTESCEFVRCIFAGLRQKTALAPYIGISIESHLVSDVLVRDCHFIGGQRAVISRGVAHDAWLEDVQIIDNHFQNNKEYSVSLSRVRGLTVKGNTFDATLAPESTSLLRCNDLSGQIEINNNSFTQPGSVKSSIELQGCVAEESLRAILANNIIQSSTGNVTGACLILEACQNWDIVNNSIVHSLPGSNTVLPVKLTGSDFDEISFKNNAVANYAGGVLLSVLQPEVIQSSDFNNWYQSGERFALLANSYVANLASWRRVTLLDASSLDVDPLFASDMSLTPRHIALAKGGTAVANLPRDINGKVRDSVSPSIGAIEYSVVGKDAALSAFTSPGIPIKPGTNAVRVNLFNNAAVPLTSATITWSIDNVTQATVTWAGILASNQTVSVTLGNSAFTGTTASKIVAQVLVADDAIASNNTVCINELQVGLSGRYRIGTPDFDFETMADVEFALRKRGVTGACVFVFEKGTHHGSLHLDAVAGHSSTNTLTFTSDGGIQRETTLLNTSGSLGYVLRLEGVSYVTVANLTMRSMSDVNGAVLHLAGELKNICVDNCLLQARDVHTGQPGLASTIWVNDGSVVEDFSLRASYISSGMDGIHLKGNSSRHKNWTISKSSFVRHSSHQLLMSNIAGLDISECIFRVESDKPSVFIKNSSAVQFKKNQMTVLKGASAIDFRTINAAIDDLPSTIVNNEILVQGPKNGDLISLRECTNTHVLYNTMRLVSGDGTDAALVSVDGGDGNSIVNNLFAVKKPSPILSELPQATIKLSDASAIASMDNNCYSDSASAYIKVADAVLEIGQFIRQGNFEQNSIVHEPTFHPFNWFVTFDALVNGRAVPSSLESMDRVGRLRDTLNPDIGANEFTPETISLVPQSLELPLIPFAPGEYQPEVKVVNNGVQAITSATVSWEFNGAAMPDFQWNGQLETAVSTDLQLSLIELTSLTGHTVRAWLSEVNGKAVEAGSNRDDTLSVTKHYAALGGDFTLGGKSPDFTSFAHLTSILKRGGIHAPVQVAVRDGDYLEYVKFEAVPRRSLSDTILVFSESADSSKVTIKPSGEAYAATTIEVTDLSDLTLRGLGVETPFSGTAIYLAGDSQNNTIDRCLLKHSDAYSGSTVYYPGLIANGVLIAQHNTVISHNTIEGGEWACSLAGGEGSFAEGTLILGNHMIGQSRGGIQVENQTACRIEQNIVSSVSGGTWAGVSVLNSGNSIRVNANFILRGAGSGHGIVLTNVASRADYPTAISNNMIRVRGDNSCRGIAMINAPNIRSSFSDVIHNSVLVESVDESASAALYESGVNSVRCLNNNLVSLGGSPVYFNLEYSTRIPGQFDYNNLYSSSNFLASVDGLVLSDLRSLQRGTRSNANSLSVEPEFYSSEDLHSRQFQIDGKGTPLQGFDIDIDGDTRSVLNPDIGADEFTPPAANVELISLQTPQRVFVAGVYPISVTVKNLAKNDLESALFAWSVNDIIQDTVSWQGRIANSEVDSVFIANYDFLPTSIQSVRVWVWNPNDTLDGQTDNDTLLVENITPGLEGVYTIGGPSADFASLNAFTQVLHFGGVLGHTKGQLRNGTYPETVEIGAIAGASSSARVAIEAESGKADSVVVENGLDDYRAGIFNLAGVQYLSLRNLTLRTNNGYFSRGINIEGNSSHLKFDSLICEAGTTPRAVPYVYAGRVGDSISFHACSFQGNAQGLELGSLLGKDAKAAGVLVSDCLFNVISPAIEVSNCLAPQITNNVVETSSEFSYLSMLYLTNFEGAYRITGNRVLPGTQASALRLSGARSTLDSPGVVANNMLHGGRETVHFVNNESVKFLFNTCRSNADDDVFELWSRNSEIELFSNIFYSAAGLNSAVVRISSRAEVLLQDNNVYYSSAGGNAVKYSTRVYSLAAWIEFSGRDSSSLFVDPQFVSDEDLHVTNDMLKDRGLYSALVPNDIDGERRDSPPDIGADEFDLRGPDLAVRGLTTPPTCSPSTFANVALRLFNPTIGDVREQLTITLSATGATLASVTELSTTLVIPAQEEIVYTMSSVFPFVATGLYNLQAVVKIDNDSNTANDTLRLQYHRPAPLTFSQEWQSVPTDSAQFNSTALFSWCQVPDAETYDCYIWPADENRPTSATYSNLTRNELKHWPNFENGSWYKWQLTAKNQCETLAGPVQSFQGAERAEFELHANLDILTDSSRLDTTLASLGYLSDIQPFYTAPWNYLGREESLWWDSTAVDWMLLELRQQTSGTVTYRAAVVLLSDGRVVGPNTAATLSVPILRDRGKGDTRPCHIVLHSRNHLPIASKKTYVFNALHSAGPKLDFRQSQDEVFRLYDAPLIARDGGLVMVPGDINQDGIINAYDRVEVRRQALEVGYNRADVNLDGVVNAIDRTVVRNNSFKAAQVP